MATLADLTALRDALERARFAGTLTVRSGDDSVTYKTDAEMRAALADLNAKIAAAGGTPRVRQLRIVSNKGL